MTRCWATAVQSTRLFPKGHGADGYRLSGIAARCDWVVLSDVHPPCTVLVEQRPGPTPRHVFLSLREPFAALAFFQQRVLPRIEAPFRLVSGSEDVTLPQQTDRRWRAYTAQESAIITAILDDPRVLCWAAENLVSREHPRWRPLPLGLTFPDGEAYRSLQVCGSVAPRQSQRPVRLLCAHRIRSGAQWDRRRQVHRLCRERLSAWATVLEQEVSEQRYQQLLRMHAFVICAEGGGIDPSPRAWQALLQGAIPIMRRSALEGAYRQLPVVMVEAWSEVELRWDHLRHWQQELMPWFDQPALRAEVLQRLSLEHWWQWINSDDPEAGFPSVRDAAWPR